MPGSERLVAALLKRKRPKKCAETVKGLRSDLLSEPKVANDHNGLDASERASALSALAWLCANCGKDCRFAGHGEVTSIVLRSA